MGEGFTGTWNKALRLARSTIRVQMEVIFSFLIAAIAVFLYILVSSKVKDDAIDAAMMRAQTVIDLTSSSMAFPLAMSDNRAVSQVITTTVKSPDVMYIVVEDPSGYVVNSIYLELAKRSAYADVGTGLSINPRRDLIRVMRPIRYIGKDLGEVYIGISLENVNAEISSFRRVIATMSVAVFLIGLIGVIGMSRVVSRPIDEMVRTVELVRAGDLSQRANEVTTGDISYLARSFNAMLDGVQEHTTSLEREITQRRIAEKKIREQAALIDLSPDATIVCNLKGQILFWSKAAERMYNLPAEKTIGKDGWGILIANHRIKQEEVGRALVAKGEWEGELTYVRDDETEIIVNSRWILLNDSTENASSIMIINTDVTERKRLHQQLLRAERMQSIGTLAGGIAHDLNNVLSPITLAVQALRPRVNDDRGRMLIDTVEQSAKRGASIIRQVLSFARGFEGERTVIQLNHLVGEFENFVRQTFPATIELKLRSEKNLWTISGDLTQVYQVLMNLCLNARDAMAHGGVLTIGLSNAVIDQHYAAQHVDARPGSYVQLEVIDTGSGIPRDLQNKIFDPFFTTKEYGKGTGLGLSTVAGIIKGHGGFLSLYSEPSKGTTFKVFFPALEAKMEADDERALADVPAGRGQVILLVDDEQAIREVARAALEANGYSVIAVNDGTEAVSTYARNGVNIELVLTDVMMPFMDGIATIRALKKLNPKLKIIAVSGLLDDQKMREIKNIGDIPFLLKPFSTEKLLLTIDSALNGGSSVEAAETATRT